MKFYIFTFFQLFILMFIFLSIIRIYNYNLKSSKIYLFYKYCLSHIISEKIEKNIIRFKYGKDLWKYFPKNINKLCSFVKSMNLFKVNNSFYYHRLYSKYNKKKSLILNGNFPDISYYRLIPKNKIDRRNIISHTYLIQEYIFNYQHPSNCKNKKFIIIGGFNSGHGSELHVLTSYLSLALSINRIAILDPYFRSKKANGAFCKDKKNWLCFLEQITNCSLPYYAFINTTTYNNKRQKEKYLYITNSQKYRKLIPIQIINFLNNSTFYEHKLLHYWRIQASTFLFRLNKKTNRETNRLIRKSIGSKLNRGCFNIWIRHGDKYKEMKLLNASDYLPSYNIYKSIIGHIIPIYLSTDDPNVIDFFEKQKLKVFYLKFLRLNDNLSGNMKRGDGMTLNFIADVKAALYCEGFSGTRKSNVVRLIDELRSTIGLSANSLYFENGAIKFSDTSYENYEYW